MVIRPGKSCRVESCRVVSGQELFEISRIGSGRVWRYANLWAMTYLLRHQKAHRFKSHESGRVTQRRPDPREVT